MRQVLLSDVCEINPRIDSGISDDAECSFVPMEYVDEVSGAIANTSVRRVGDVKKGYTFFKNDDVIFAKITPCMENGKCAIGKNLKNGIAFGSTEYHVVRAKEEIIPEWIYHFLRQERIRQQATGWFRGTAGQQRVPATFLEELKIPLPPLTEQKRIASLLARADRLRQLRRTAHDLGDALLQSVFLEMFGDVAYSKWDKSELGELIEGFEAGVNYLPGHEGEKVSEWRVLKISAVTWGDFDPTESKAIREYDEFDETHIVRQGDLLISRANTTELVGAVSLVKIIPPKVLLPDKLWRVKFKEDSVILPEYTLHVLRQPELRKIIVDLATGSSGSMKNISMEKAYTLPIPVPPLSLQEEFAGVVARVESLRGRMGESTRQVEGLFESLLSESFGGS